MTAQDTARISKKHFVEIDYLRCFAILAVIAIHTAAALTRVPDPANYFAVSLWQSLSSFAVPLFITISGFVLWLSYKPSTIGGFYRRRFLRIIPPYLIFTVVYLVANILKSFVVTGIFHYPSWGEIVNAFLFATSNEHMWFFLIIIELYLFYPAIHAVYQKLMSHSLDWILLIAGFIIQTAWSNFSGGLFIQVNDIPVYLSNKIFLCVIFYFILGMYICHHYSAIQRVLRSIITGVVLSLFSIVTAVFAFIIPQMQAYGMMNISYCVSAIFLLFFVSVHLVSVSEKNIFVTIGLYSFGIYLIHPLIQGLFGYVIYPALSVTPEVWAYYPLVFITTTVLSILGVYLIKKLPYNKYIIG